MTELPWPNDVVDALQRFVQGDLLDGVPFVYYGLAEGGLPIAFPTDTVATEERGAGAGDPAPGAESSVNAEIATAAFEPVEWVADDGRGLAIITSQTCDLCEEGTPEQPWFQVCPVRLLDQRYAERTLPSYLYPIAPPDLDEGCWVVDFRFEQTVEKTFLVERHPLRAFASESEAIAFADALGRRRARAALAEPLVRAVGDTLRRRRRNNDNFKRMLREDIRSVRLRIEEGTRRKPVSVRVHVVALAEVTNEIRDRFGGWWDGARSACEEKGISLLETGFHDGRHMDLDVYDASIPLDLGE